MDVKEKEILNSLSQANLKFKKENVELIEQNKLLREQIESLEEERIHRQMIQHGIPIIGSEPECLI